MGWRYQREGSGCDGVMSLQRPIALPQMRRKRKVNERGGRVISAPLPWCAVRVQSYEGQSL